jgi:choline kinase/DNA-binding XRE family transcriptional regulator
MDGIETFGGHIQTLRARKEIGLRELARIIGISASYLNDIEKDKRAAPKKETVQKISAALDADLENLYDLAAKSQNNLPSDVAELVSENAEIVSLMREIGKQELSSRHLQDLKESVESAKIKAIVIAAGMGSRLKHYTEELPKCMLEMGGTSILQRQIDIFHECGISDINIVRGYQKEKINYPGIAYFDNDNYENNNILNSLFCAEEVIAGNVIVSYSDIVFRTGVVDRLLASTHDISIVVDIDWRHTYKARSDHPIEEAESVIFDTDNHVVEIGKIVTNKDDVHGEFIGMMKFTPRGAEIFKRHFNRSKELFWGKPFQRAPVFEKAYITDMIQEMVDLGVPIHSVIIERGWKEIDTVEDFENAIKEMEG